MIAESTPNAPTCITHTRDDEPDILKDEDPTPTQFNDLNTDPTLEAVCYKQTDCRLGQVNLCHTVKISDEISKIYWREERMLPEE